jgi:hypothetical protein
MVDVTVTIITHEKASDRPPDHPGRWRVGEVVNVREQTAIPIVAAELPYSFLHVVGATMTFERIKNFLLAEHQDGVKVRPDDPEPQLVARRRFQVELSELPPDLLVEREATMLWTDFIQAVWRRKALSLDRDRRARAEDL